MNMERQLLNGHLISSENQMEGECRQYSTELVRKTKDIFKTSVQF